MKNLWNINTAKKYISKYNKINVHKDLALRIYTTHLLGYEKKLVLHGGGNTSVKLETKVSQGNHRRSTSLPVLHFLPQLP